MGEGGAENKDPWIDIVKWAACMLVLSGHFFQSMTKSGIMGENAIYQWFIHTIYLFHVPLFFVCSGYLYQKNSVVTTLEEWKESVFRKLVTLGVPYFTFSTATFLMKKMFHSSVNDEITGGFWQTLLLDPPSPYWYLYVLFFLFLFLPTFKSGKQAGAALAFSVLLYFFHQNPQVKGIYFLGGTAHRMVWFVAGMCLCLCRRKIKFDGKCLGLSFLLFPLSIMGYNKEMQWLPYMLYSLTGGICGSLLILELSFWLSGRVSEKFILFSRKNTLPVFLMHTIFAAGIRTVLLKMGITGTGIHAAAGISGSIFLPVAAAEVMRRSGWLYFFIHPNVGRKDRRAG